MEGPAAALETTLAQLRIRMNGIRGPVFSGVATEISLGCRAGSFDCWAWSDAAGHGPAGMTRFCRIMCWHLACCLPFRSGHRTGAAWIESSRRLRAVLSIRGAGVIEKVGSWCQYPDSSRVDARNAQADAHPGTCADRVGSSGGSEFGIRSNSAGEVRRNLLEQLACIGADLARRCGSAEPSCDQQRDRASSLRHLSSKAIARSAGFVWTYCLGWRVPEYHDEPLKLDPAPFGKLVHEILEETVRRLEYGVIGFAGLPHNK